MLWWCLLYFSDLYCDIFSLEDLLGARGLAVHPDQALSYFIHGGWVALHPTTSRHLPVVGSSILTAKEPAVLVIPSLGPQHYSLCVDNDLSTDTDFSLQGTLSMDLALEICTSIYSTSLDLLAKVWLL